MKRVAIAALSALVLGTTTAWAAPQAPIIEPPHVQAKDVGYSLGAAAVNVVYFPVRLAVTTLTAAAGGFTGFMIGGDPEAAAAIWDSTDGQAYITPEILDGSEPLRPFVRPEDRYVGALDASAGDGDTEAEATVAGASIDETGYRSDDTIETPETE
ncbi:hypothetical protein L6Q96_19115 [Candidatus Binatia bacterium]|nr:hypothetical protein [Candidatus Binatia bacterium]